MVSGTSGRYNEVIDYQNDKMGNIHGITRYENGTQVENINLQYQGNQLKKADNAINHFISYGSELFNDSVNSSIQNEYAYDNNGNMLYDSNGEVSAIQYNLLNLPDKIHFTVGHKNLYTYNAGGQKLRAVNYTTHQMVNIPLGIITPLSSTPSDYTVLTTDYVGNIIYENGTLKQIMLPDGYWQNGVFYYYLKDHLGSNRVTINSSGTVVEKSHYYPSGTRFYTESTSNSNALAYRYNGKEMETMNGLNQMDYGARRRFSWNPSWTAIDPLAEKYYSISPYAYCGGNSINRIDPDGMDWYSYQEEYTDENGKKQTRTAYKYVRGEMSEKEIEKGGYTHLGKTYDNGKGIYFSLGGAEIKYDKDNALNLMGINKIKDVDNSIIATIEGAKAVGDFWNKYGEVINNVTNATEIFGEYMDISKGFRGIVSKFGILTTTAQVGVDAYALINGELKGVRLMDAVVNLASLAGTPGAAISLTYSGTKKAANEMVKLEYSLRTFIPQLIKNANNGYWPY